MRIHIKCKIAIDAMIDIAAHTERGYVISLPVISKRLNISHSYLELIFSKLKTAGLIYSQRGPGGGYSLAKAPGDISVKDIVDATIDAQSLASGLSAELWINLEKHMQNQMLQITLSRILADTPVAIDPTLECLGTKLLRAQVHSKRLTKKTTKTTATKMGKALGPNSVFSLGKFILQK